MDKEEAFLLAGMLFVILLITGQLSLDSGQVSSWLSLVNLQTNLGIPVGLLAVIIIGIAVVYEHEKGKK